MTCHDARELFSGWIDDALTSAEREGVGAHLAECAECRKEFQRFEATVALLHRAERPRAPAGFVDRVLEAASPTPWHRRFLRRLFVPLSVKLPAEAAAALLVAGLAVYVFQRTPELQQAARHDAQSPRMVQSQAPSPESPARQELQPRMLKQRDAPSPPAPGQFFSDAGPSVLATKPMEAPVSPESKAKAPVAPQSRMGSAANEVAKASPGTPPPAERPTSSGEHTESRKDATSGDAGTPRALEAPALAPPSAPMMRERRDSALDKTQAPPPAPAAAAPRAAPRSLPPADIVGRLSVRNRDDAERALAEALARAGGVVVSRREEGGATVVDVTIPKAAYPEFSEGLARIGAWRPEGQPAELPPSVRITLRLVE